MSIKHFLGKWTRLWYVSLYFGTIAQHRSTLGQGKTPSGGRTIIPGERDLILYPNWSQKNPLWRELTSYTLEIISGAGLALSFFLTLAGSF